MKHLKMQKKLCVAIIDAVTSTQQLCTRLPLSHQDNLVSIYNDISWTILTPWKVVTTHEDTFIYFWYIRTFKVIINMVKVTK